MKIRHLNWVSFCLVVFLHSGFGPVCEAFQSVEGDTSASKIANQGEASNTQTSESRDQTEFLRVHSDEFNNPVALQTATTKYVLKNDEGEVEFEVFLESVIHIADSSYYRSCQQRLEQYDTVLYELVTNPVEDKSKEEKLPSGYQLFQQVSTGTLGLAYQLDEVDYNAKNMLHADLSRNEMADQMADRGETSTTLLVDLLAHILKKGKRRIAIFYGAGHMADFERRLVEEHGMELVVINWRNAWDLRDGAIEGGPLESLIESTFRDSIKNKLRQFAKGHKEESETGNSKDAVESEKDEKIKSMEKALEAKLNLLGDEAARVLGFRPLRRIAIGLMPGLGFKRLSETGDLGHRRNFLVACDAFACEMR